MTDFEGVIPPLGRALAKRGYETLTPVQDAVLDPALAGADMLVSAQTGSGKTVAFGMAMAPTLLGDAERFGKADVPLALAVAPTRELALQVCRELEWLYAETGAQVATCVGGMDMRDERRALGRGAHIVVGTPGRLRDHIQRGSLDLSGMKAVVLDEADEMLDLGFREDLEFILDAAPEDRRTLLFSATVPRSIATLAQRFQRDAVRVVATSDRERHADIDYRAIVVAPTDKENAIVNLLRFHEAKNALVFCGTRAMVNHLSSRFNNRGFSVVSLSGELSQNERTHALQALRDGRARVCVATDVAARGIDLPDLELVIHADLPTNRETLTHRSGRTGRAGRKGVSALIVPYNARRKAERLLQGANAEATWERPPSIDDVRKRDDERFLANPAFENEPDAEAVSFAGQLIERFGAEKAIAALVKMHRDKLSAPEELLDTTPVDAPRERTKTRDHFDDGVWFSISIGRKQNAEPRWLIPMLCSGGHLTKRHIGAIKIQQSETFVHLDAKCVERFLAAIGPAKTLEKSIRVKQLDGTPDFSDAGGERQGKPRGKPPFKGKPKGGAARDGFKHRKGFKKKADRGDAPLKRKKSKGGKADS